MTSSTRPSLDDPALTIPLEHAGIFEPIPLARTERQQEFYALRDGEMLLNMGPQHPSTHGVLRVVLKINGEQVVDLDPVLGYLHRGVEKIAENSDFHHIISQLDPLEYISSLFCEWSPVMSFEKLLFNYLRIGGVNGDLNHEFLSRLGDWMGRATQQIENNIGLLNENEIFVRRMRGLGTIDTATALRMVMSGPNLRATGVPFDVRRAHPYSVYPELEFDIPSRSEGDCLARYLLRLDEVRQSIRIIDQCLHQMPDGPVMAKLPRLLRPRPGRAYAAVEGPRGQYATYAVSDGTDQPFRMRIHDPSFIHLQAVGVMMPGHLLADTMAIMASLDPIMGGVDK